MKRPLSEVENEKETSYQHTPTNGKNRTPQKTPVVESKNLKKDDVVTSNPFTSFMESFERMFPTRNSLLQGRINFLENVMNTLLVVKETEKKFTKKGTQPKNEVQQSTGRVESNSKENNNSSAYPDNDMEERERSGGYSRYAQDGFATQTPMEAVPFESFVNGDPNINDRPVNKMSSPTSNVTHSRSTHQRRSNQHPSNSTRLKNGIPIIIVPNVPTAIVKLGNVREFLQDLQYFTPEEARERRKAKGIKERSLTEVLIERKLPSNHVLRYRVIDNPLNLSSYEWKLVVAVFVIGKDYQFKQWPFKLEPMKILKTIRGIFVQVDGKPSSDLVKKWPLTVIELHSQKRHLDRLTIIRVWEDIDRLQRELKH
ncbi:hypothetical protein SNEBB_000146 [Seison nebaliae]|nr:hypothetical protein SNEBB_000146 [Seison nebaliae]